MTAIKVEHPYKEETQFLLEQVFACSCFSNWMSLHIETQNTPFLGHPVAYWEGECWQVFWERDQDAEPFDPYHSLDDAWLLLDEIRPGRAMVEDIEKMKQGNQQALADFLYRGSVTNVLAYQLEGWWSMTRDTLCAAICGAVLYAYHYQGEEKETHAKAGL